MKAAFLFLGLVSILGSSNTWANTGSAITCITEKADVNGRKMEWLVSLDQKVAPDSVDQAVAVTGVWTECVADGGYCVESGTFKGTITPRRWYGGFISLDLNKDTSTEKLFRLWMSREVPAGTSNGSVQVNAQDTEANCTGDWI